MQWIRDILGAVLREEAGNIEQAPKSEVWPYPAAPNEFFECNGYLGRNISDCTLVLCQKLQIWTSDRQTIFPDPHWSDNVQVLSATEQMISQMQRVQYR